MDKQNLIVAVMDDSREFGAAPDQVAGRELALENRVLKVIAETAHSFENFAQALFIGNVVANKIGLSHEVNGGGAACGRRRGAERQ